MIASRSPSVQPDGLDTGLIILYLVGIYLGLDIQVTASVPIPTAISGLAGGLLLVKHMHRFRERQIGAVLLVIALYLGSILSASGAGWLPKRFTGLVQISYSLLIAYGLYLAATLYDRQRLARIFLVFCVLILIGCLLENNIAAFRSLSDTVRGKIFSFGVYESDLRDLLLYGHVRAKLFTSEPSAVTFAFTIFAFAWYVLSTWRLKLLAYGAMFAAAFMMMRGPTLLLGLVLVVPYEVFLAARRDDARYDAAKVVLALSIAAILLVLAVVVGSGLYAERIEEIRDGDDPSFFSRVIAPPIVAAKVIELYPVAGIGLTAEQFIVDEVRQVFAQSGGWVNAWYFEEVKHVITNYFWTHWIYLGIVWGIVLIFGLSWMLRALEAPSILFCWSVWAILGQASGAYVSPKTWTVFFLACIVSIVHERSRRERLAARRAMPRRLAPAPRAPGALVPYG